MSLTYAGQQEGSASTSAGKSAAIIAVALLHLGFLYAFTHGLNVVNIIKPLKDTVTVFIPEEIPPQPPLALPKPRDIPIDNSFLEIPAPQPIVVPADIPLQVPSGETVNAAPDVTATPTYSSLAIKRRIDPQYPAASRRAGEAGTVLLSVVIGPDGAPSEIDVERSSGYAALDQSAMAAVRQWRFTVANDGSYSRVRLPITFRLEAQR